MHGFQSEHSTHMFCDEILGTYSINLNQYISINPCMSFSLTWEGFFFFLYFTRYDFDKENVHCIRELLSSEKEGVIKLLPNKTFV
jgi:hypothetical protein